MRYILMLSMSLRLAGKLFHKSSAAFGKHRSPHVLVLGRVTVSISDARNLSSVYLFVGVSISAGQLFQPHKLGSHLHEI